MVWQTFFAPVHVAQGEGEPLEKGEIPDGEL